MREPPAAPAARSGFEELGELVSQDANEAVRLLLLSEPPAAHEARGAAAEALREFAGHASIELCHDVAAARAALAAGRIRLAVADLRVNGALRWLAELREAAGPPAIAIARNDAEAVAAFRAGAAECVGAREIAEALAPAARDVLARQQRALAAHAAPDALDRAARNAVEHMNSALLVLDARGDVSFANRAAAQLLGIEDGRLTERPFADWFPGVPRAELLVQRTLTRGEKLRGAECMITREDGSAIPIGLSASPLRGERGQVEGAIVLFQDLTDIKQLERQLLQREKMASIGQLAAGIAHEINNPMGFIHANLSQLGEYLDDFSRVWEALGALRKAALSAGAEVRVAAEAAESVIADVDAEFLLRDFGTAIRESLEGAQRIRAIVSDLRSFSHRDSEAKVHADVNKALDSTANIVWTMMKHSVALSKAYAELPPVLCFPMQLQQVFMNLLMNAYQAIEERRQRDGAPGEVRLRTELADGGVRIAVADNGVGMAPDVQRRIFDPFFTTKEVGVGTGLGLSTSYQIVRRHGGKLTFESRRGVGTTFWVWLPLDDESGA
jgi:PAS domain S-box-containing protein